MNKTLKGLGATTITAALLFAAAAPAFASTPPFTLAAPGKGMSVSAFGEQLQTFNRAEVADLLHATKVTVVRFDTAWADGGDASTALDTLNSSDQSIHLLREALKADPAAMRLLAANHISVNQVIDIAPAGKGAVQLYVS
ncbi:MAG: hypothetical protein JWQ89_3133 [Devosia sp.]|uniref:hypothetical protein n=1 Tax=Devosia sp. TaxID=1871048 RepID=UPI00262C8F78|nr:hypothetical protein [Devosia sp.]MDB5541406.1 hypothetical protein [Devosia sp.]